jgi:hypothetical protein
MSKLAATVLALALTACATAPPSPSLAPQPFLPVETKTAIDRSGKYVVMNDRQRSYQLITLTQTPYDDKTLPKKIVYIVTAFTLEPSIVVDYETESCSNMPDKRYGRACTRDELHRAQNLVFDALR